MEAGVVTDHVDLPVASQPRAKVFQVPNEQGRVATLALEPLGHDQIPRSLVERTGQISLLVVPRRLDLGLLAATHPHAPDLGVGIHVHLVLKHGDLVGR